MYTLSVKDGRYSGISFKHDVNNNTEWLVRDFTWTRRSCKLECACNARHTLNYSVLHSEEKNHINCTTRCSFASYFASFSVSTSSMLLTRWNNILQ